MGDKFFGDNFFKYFRNGAQQGYRAVIITFSGAAIFKDGDNTTLFQVGGEFSRAETKIENVRQRHGDRATYKFD